MDSSSLFATETSLLFILIAMIVDIRTRRFPFWLFATTSSFCWYFLIDISLLGAFAGLVMGLVADVPGGDLRFMVILGAIVGAQIVCITLGAAFMVTLVAWNRGLTGVPWTVYIGLVYPPISLIHSTLYPLFIKAQ